MGHYNVLDYRFSPVDYLVFAFMLGISACTGVYFGYRHKCMKTREKLTVRDYLTGERKMRTFPVAMSLVASYVSGVTMLGTPAEIYNFGAMYWLILIAIWLSGLVIGVIYLPVFIELQVYSSYEYLELRFDSRVRTIVSFLFLLDEVMFLPMVVYVPSLAFSQVSGLDLHIIGSITIVVCVFYTILGGLRAVVYTDTWQIIIMFFATLAIVILGTVHMKGGAGTVFQRAADGGRISDINTSFSFYERYTLISVIFGGFIYWTSFNAVNQTMVQRYMSLPTLAKSELSLFLFIVGVSFFISLCCYAGLLLYASYYDCDPLTAGRISADDQLLPLLVVEMVGYLNGVPGLFIAGVFGAALSSLSVIFNSTSVVFIEDFLKAFLKLHPSENQMRIISISVVLVSGAISLGGLYIVEHLGGVLSVATSLSAIASGTTFGIFTLGMLVPWATTKGAIVGGIAGFLTSSVVSYGSQFVNAYKYVVPHKLPVSVVNCEERYGILVNATEPIYPDESHIFPLFRLSYLWVTPIGVFTVLLVGIIISFITGKTDLKNIDPLLITPIFRRFLPPEAQQNAGTSITRTRQGIDQEELITTNTPTPSTIRRRDETQILQPTSSNNIHTTKVT